VPAKRPLFAPEFNRSIRVEARPEHLTADAGVVVLREALDRLGTVDWLVQRLADPRNPDRITHPLAEMLRTSLLLLAQGWRDKDDADTLRHDAVCRLAVSDRSGLSPLEVSPRPEGQPPPRNPPAPEGLPSQPTLSRLARSLSTGQNRQVLRRGLREAAARRLRSLRRGHRPRTVTVDVDSLPVEVHGHQPGSEYNGHYHARLYHPLVASIAETGDLVDVRLRPGRAHTADGALAFIDPLLTEVEERLCQVASVRFDAGFPEDELLSALEKRRTPYVARIRNNAVLDRMALPYLRRPPGGRPAEPRTWFHELTYRAESWPQPRRVVLVVQERENELLLHHFWLLTNWSVEQMTGEALLALYRQRGTAENHMGERMSVLDPALSSSPRPKAHYRGAPPRRRTPSGNAFDQNEVILLLHALAYEVAHTVRVLFERATHKGWGLRAVRERVLRVPARLLLHARRAVLVLGAPAARWWWALWSQLMSLRYAEA
jgi:hypothetical protein